MSFMNNFHGAQTLIHQLSKHGATITPAVTEALKVRDDLATAVTELHSVKATLTDAVVDAVAAGTNPLKDDRVLDALNATTLLNNMLGTSTRVDDNVVDAMRESAPELAAQLVPEFDEAATRLTDIAPILDGLDPLDARDNHTLRNSNNPDKLVAVVEAMQLSRKIVELGDLHESLLYLAGHRGGHGYGKWSVVPIQKAIEYTNSALDQWCQLKPVSALAKGLRLELLDLDARARYRSDFETADAERKARNEQAAMERAFR